MLERLGIIPTTKPELTRASALLKNGSSVGGRVMSEASVARREGVTPPKAPAKSKR